MSQQPRAPAAATGAASAPLRSATAPAQSAPAQPTAAPAQSAAAPAQSPAAAQSVRPPMDRTLQAAFALSMSEMKPILADYWEDSFNGKAVVEIMPGPSGTAQGGTRWLAKPGSEEYTSSIQAVQRLTEPGAQNNQRTDYIIQTENSVYLVSSAIASRLVSAPRDP